MRRLRHQGAPSPAARSTAEARTHPVALLHDLGEPAGLWHTAFPANPALLDRAKRSCLRGHTEAPAVAEEVRRLTVLDFDERGTDGAQLDVHKSSSAGAT
jgi:hypothetical protein